MIIRTEQLEALGKTFSLAFEDRTYAHLLEYSPRHCELLGAEQMREVIRFGRRKAESYELTVEPCIRSYIDLMCMLGGRFDTNPLLPWAAEILTDKSSSDQIARGDRLYDRAWEYIQHIIPDYRDASGQPTTSRFVGELRKLRDLGDDLLTPDNIPGYSRWLRQWIEAVFPAKSRYVGGEALDCLVTNGVARAATYGISELRGVTTVVMFMFVLGGGFDSDPLIPWASATLNDREITGRTRGDRLYAQGVNFLRRWWDSAPKEES